MRFAAFTQRVLLTALTLAGGSCTIIQDSDITDPNDTDKLMFKSIEIDQEVNAGNQVSTATVVLNTSNKVEKINWPALGNKKLKFRSPVSGQLSTVLNYTGSRLTSFDTQSGSQSVEKYTFEYNATGNVFKIVSTGTFANGVVKTVDSLTYDGQGRISRFDRTLTSSTGTKTTKTISSISYQSSGLVERFTYDKEIKQNQGFGYCPNDLATPECLRYESPFGPGNSPNVLIKRRLTGELTRSIELSDVRTGGNQGCFDCSRAMDDYYLHPFLLFKDYFPKGDALVVIYLIDWWTPGTATPSGSITKNDVVTFNFLYGI